MSQNSAGAYFHANRSGMARFLPKQYSRVLEVGCASGAFSRHFSQGVDSWGIEPNAKAAELARAHYKHVLCGRYDEVANELPDAYFDLIVCNDVIEHMPDHDAFIDSLRSKLSPGAVLVGSLPNVRHITALVKVLLLRDWPYAESGILDRTHLRFFTHKSMLRFFGHHKLEVEELRGIGSVIRHGLVRPERPLPRWKSALFRLGVFSVVVATLGFYRDTQYPQFAFRVRFPG